jgi:excisionase family DNA binding protein
VERLIPIREASELLGGISRFTLYGWISQGRIRRVKIGGRVMIPTDEIRRLQRGEGLAPAEHHVSESVA